MNTNAGWNGRRVAEARAIVATWLPTTCPRCRTPVTPGTAWVVGHIKSRATHPELTWEVSNWAAEHRTCSDRSAQATVIEKARADALRDAGLDPADFPRHTTAGQLPILPVSPSGPSVSPVEVPRALTWPEATRDAPEWLRSYLPVPGDVAAEPLAMSPPHPEASGSYGPALIEWAEETQGVRVRWWQGLVICRVLEHREDGSLCWEEVILSCSRRSGKSVIVRLLALWRLWFAPAIFGEMQLIVHSANTLRVAKEPMRYASRWAMTQARLIVSTNNNNFGIEDREGGHRWIVLPPDKTAGLDTCMGVLDEAWSCKPEVVDDDLEPSLLERVSPQLLMVSTAHRRATSLMRGRISGALAGEGAHRTLLLLWGALPQDDPGDPDTWRRASPHWSVQREQYLARKWEKAQRGEQDIEFDDPDPAEGFRAQLLNVWPLRQRATGRGAPVVEEVAWGGLVEPVPFVRPDAVAVEGWPGEGISVALAWRVEGRSVVSVVGVDDLAAAAVVARESGFRGSAIVGKSLVDDPGLKGVRRKPGEGRTGAAVQAWQRLLAEGAVRHDGGEHLTAQMLAVRTLPGADGPRMASTERADAVKAAAWAIERSVFARSRNTRIVLPSQATA